MNNGPDVEVAFSSRAELRAWLAKQPADHPGVWVRLAKSGSGIESVTFHDLLEAGIAYGWSESTRCAGDSQTYLQRFTPRRTRGTTSPRNKKIAAELEAAGLMTQAGRDAL